METEVSASCFIAIEGIDGVGSTTHAERLAASIEQMGRSVLQTREPTERDVGELIRRYLSGEFDVPGKDADNETLSSDFMGLLFAADRIDHLYSEILPSLEEGHIVVSDRYYHSSFVYQAEQRDGDLQTGWIETVNRHAVVPDLTIFLDAPVEVCFERLSEQTDKDIYEKKAFLKEIAPRYRTVVNQLQERGENIIKIDADRPADEVAEEIRGEIQKRFGLFSEA
jgi:dTMP kinase